MGLSGPKKRTKLSSDPNNTTWSKSTEGFGHKILSAQGWKPGQLLGAENAAHAEHFTAANASHIRVMLREDNLGLGANLGANNAETFGLRTLSGIFGRLNGKSDADVEKMQNAQRDIELRAYQTHKFGQMTFVRGGLLLGDKMEEDSLSALVHKAEKPVATSHTPSEQQSQKKKKRKHDDIDQESRPKKKASKEAKQDQSPDERTDDDDAPDIAAHPSDDEKALKVRRKAEKRARKEERQKRREKRANRKEERRKHESTSGTHVEAPSAQPAPPPSASFGGSRQAFRQRFMQQKKLASLDARALSEIFMLKPAVA